MGTLFPVSGLIVIGPHAMADRYTYVPLIGLFILATWGCGDIFRRWQVRRGILVGAGVAVLATLAVASWKQVGYWKDNVTVYGRAGQ